MPAAKKKADTSVEEAVAPVEEAVVEVAPAVEAPEREVATKVEAAAVDAAHLAQTALVSSREYGEAIRRESVARNRLRRAEAQKAQTLRPAT